MELQIQDLVSSIRKDGIDAANAEAEAIITEAKKKAEAIVQMRNLKQKVYRKLQKKKSVF